MVLALKRIKQRGEDYDCLAARKSNASLGHLGTEQKFGPGARCQHYMCLDSEQPAASKRKITEIIPQDSRRIPALFDVYDGV
jgi:hypothetical protein